MAVPQLRDRVLEDRLRAMEIRMAALERRTPVGDAVSFSPALTPSGSFPTMTTYAEYIRTNNMMTCNIEWVVTATVAPSGSIWGWTVLPPYPFDFVSGSWTWQRLSFGTLFVAGSGPITEADASYGAGRVLLGPSKLGIDVTGINIADDQIEMIDLQASITAGVTAIVTDTWDVGDHVQAIFTCRIPDGY